jgi:hypothetical protein
LSKGERFRFDKLSGSALVQVKRFRFDRLSVSAFRSFAEALSLRQAQRERFSNP